MKRFGIHTSFFSFSCILLLLGGCGSKKSIAPSHNSSDATDRMVDKNTVAEESLRKNIQLAIDNGSYRHAQDLLQGYIARNSESEELAGYKLMLADVHYEQEQYQAAYDLYTHFQEFYPVDDRAEYASFRAAHALFAQRGALACDATETERTVTLCESYLGNLGYVKFRKQMGDLEETCKKNLLHKEFYVADAYLNQNKLNSAQQRLRYIAQSFDLDHIGGRDRLLFYQAKLAKKCGDSASLDTYVSDLHEEFPDSQFTALASRLHRPSLF